MNFKNILFQFLAGLCLMLGFKQFFIFADLDLIELISSMGKESFTYFANKSDKFGISEKITRLLQAQIILGFVAILINYFVLFFIAFKRKLNWNISLVITILLCLIHYFKLIDGYVISFLPINLVAAYIIPAFIYLLLAGILYVFSFRTTSK